MDFEVYFSDRGGKQLPSEEVVLHHHTTCTDTSEDMMACVTTILQEVSDALVSGHLMAYRRPVNLLDNSPKRLRQYETVKSRVSLSLKMLDRGMHLKSCLENC